VVTNDEDYSRNSKPPHVLDDLEGLQTQLASITPVTKAGGAYQAHTEGSEDDPEMNAISVQEIRKSKHTGESTLYARPRNRRGQDPLKSRESVN
jgi:hypothetical protein